MARTPRSLAILSVTLVLAACSAPAIASPDPSGPVESPRTQSSPSSRPSGALPSPTPAASVAAATPAPSSRPTSRPAAWSGAKLIRGGECSDLAATIDASGRRHVAVVCDGGIRYLTSPDGGDWDETPFVPAIDRIEKEPQIAVDGEAIHVAYSLLAPVEGGCGGDGLDDLGVYIRSRKGLNAAWSDPVRVGREGDRLQGFRAVGGVFHLTVTANDGRSIFYQAQSPRGSTRIAIPGAVSTSLRVSDDGHARIAYATGRAIKYARVVGNELSIETVAASDATFLKSPSLVLGGDQRAYVTWIQTTDPGGGCVGPEPGPLDGTYVAIEDGAGWSVKRITPLQGGASLTLDPFTGGVDVVISGGSLTHFTSSGGAWSSETIPGSEHVGWLVLRRDPVTGALVVFGNKWQGGVVTLTKS